MRLGTSQGLRGDRIEEGLVVRLLLQQAEIGLPGAVAEEEQFEEVADSRRGFDCYLKRLQAGLSVDEGQQVVFDGEAANAER